MAKPLPPTRYIALLRGINVGRAKRIAMAELRGIIEELGFTEVHTLLNSGNAVFQGTRALPGRIAKTIEAAIKARFGFSVAVVVLTAEDLSAIVVENELRHAASQPSRFLVAFAAHVSVLDQARPLIKESWTPDAIFVGSKAVYLWCAGGILESRLLKAFTRATGDCATARNWATVLKLLAATVVPDR